MPSRRRPAGESALARGPRARRARGVQALILVDGSKLRRAARKRYEAARRKLDAARGGIERFRTQDEPAYSRWIALKFGPLLTEAREVARRCELASTIVRRVRLIALHERVSLVQAYRIWKASEAARANATAEEPDEEERGARKDAGGATDEPPGDESSREDEADPFGPDAEADFSLDDMFQDLASMLLGRPPRDEKRLKSVYRKLARKLHPDAGAVMSEETRIFWQRAQEAYQNRDLEALELVLQMVEDQEDALKAQTSVSTLRRLTEGVQRALRSLRRELTECRRSPAWDCAAHPPSPAHETALRVSFTADLERARAQQEELEDTIAEWERSIAEKPQTSHTPTKRPRRERPIDPRQDTFDLF